MSAQGTTMKELIDEMLETARLEQTLELDLEPIDLRDSVREAVNRTARAFDSPDRIRLQMPDEPVGVLGDRGRLVMTVSALLDNALKYSAPRRGVACTVEVEDGSAVVTVRDRGRGISAEDMPRLFTRFGRIVTSDNAGIPGTGLGLYLAQRFANMHGGRITVDSEPGKGSSFSLRIPIAADREVPGDLAASA
jgi:signal transduction histidine kinase